MENRLFEYFKNALKGGLCATYKHEWQKAKDDKELLARLAMQQQSLPHVMTYAASGQGLTKEYVTDAFADYINGYTAIDVDGVDGGYKTQMWAGFDGYIYVDQADVMAFMWCEIEAMSIRTAKAVKIYVGCGSTINLSCDGYNNVTIMLFDDSKVCLDDIDKDSHVTIFRYSDKATVECGRYCMGDVNLHDKELRL